MLKQTKVGIFLFSEVEVLDFAGPFEVFSISAVPETGEKTFIVKTVSEEGQMISTRNGLKVVPDYSFDNAPDFDLLIIPGGYGAEEIEINNPNVIQWIKHQSSAVQILASVCTGAFLLAKAGVLENKSATTHWMDIDRLDREFPSIKVVRGVKYVDEGPVLTSGGISAGINLSFHLVRRLYGIDVARTAARRMEYDIEL